MQLLYVLNNNVPVSPATNPLLFSVLGVTLCTAFQNKVFLVFDFGLNKKVFL